MATTDTTNGNEISASGKRFGGFLLIFFTLLAIITMIAHWPDRMPPINDGNVSTKYHYKWFDITYLGKSGVPTSAETLSNPSHNKEKKTPAGDSTIKQHPDSTTTKSDSISTSDSVKKQKTNIKENNEKKCSPCGRHRTIDLNTLILLLVALGGFLGNMIHIASSLTNFIGAEKFKRSWTLWYFVKPFTAAALAVGVYIIFRAGFLNSSEATASVNLYGVVAIAILAGLFTDMATQKLKEVFGVIFQSSTARPNPLELPPLKITSVNPELIPLNTETVIVLSGVGFDNRIIKMKIGAEDIKDPDIKPNAITFKFKATTENPKLVLLDEKGAEIGSYDLKTTTAAAAE